MLYSYDTVIKNGQIKVSKELIDYSEGKPLILTRGTERNKHDSMFLFSQKVWNGFEKNIKSLDLPIEKKRMFLRYYASSAVDVDIDKDDLIITVEPVLHFFRDSKEEHKVRIYYEEDSDNPRFIIEFLDEDKKRGWILDKFERIKRINIEHNSLVPQYFMRPKSYFVKADAGYGKTTMLKHFSNVLRGVEVYDEDGCLQTLIPIFLSMYDVNFLSTYDIEKGPIIELLRKKNIFNHKIERDGIIQMIKNDNTYRYVFLLDGMNEMQERLLEVDSLYSIIEREIIELLKNDNVDFIVSARSERIFTERIIGGGDEEGKLIVLELQGINLSNGAADKKRIIDYLEIDEDRVPVDLWEELESPMLLKYYKKILQHDNTNSVIRCKTDLLDRYYELDIDKSTDETNTNEWDLIRRQHLLKWVLPGVAFYIENKLLSLRVTEEILDIDLTTIFNKVCDEFEEFFSDCPGGRKKLWNGLLRLQICDSNGKFVHDIIREYWAGRGLLLRFCYLHEDKTSQSFVDNLSLNIVRGKEKFEVVRQTRHIGLIEVIYDMIRKLFTDSYDNLCKAYAMVRKGDNTADTEDYRCIFELLFNYMSMLDDLQYRDKAAEVGWFVYDGISEDHRQKVFASYKAEGRGYRLVQILNDMGYSTNNSNKIEAHKAGNKEGNPDALTILSLANKELEELFESKSGLSEYERNKLYYEMKGKIINNSGAYYYGIKDYDKALSTHKEAMEYRKTVGIDLKASYRVIASDHFMIGNRYSKGEDYMHALGEHIEAYNTFKEYLGYIEGKGIGEQTNESVKFSELDDSLYKDIEFVQLINAIGNQIAMLFLYQKTYIPYDLIDEWVYELLSEFRYCNEYVEQNSRRRSDEKEKLDEKKKQLRKWFDTYYLHRDNFDVLERICMGIEE